MERSDHPHMYEPLPQGSIRLLQLHSAASFDSPLAGSLIVATIEEQSNYEALSYSWDGAFDDIPIEPGTILLDNVSLSITGNLRDGLRRLRNPEHIRELWVDAICINQQDLTERASQVAIMSTIYASASQVLIWLGEDSPEEEGRMFLDVLCQPGYPRERCGEPQRPGDVTYAEDGNFCCITHFMSHNQSYSSDCDCAICCAAKKFFSRRYWHRFWVVQEYGSARDITVFCGPYQAQYRTMSELGIVLPPGLRTRLGHIQSASEYMASQDLDMLRLLETCRFMRLESGDSRDRIYSMLGFGKETLKGIVVDYHSTPSAVFSSFAREMIRKFGFAMAFRLLYIAGTERGRYDPTMPSWVPDWSVQDHVQTTGIAPDERRHRDCEASIGEAGELKLRLACYGPMLSLPAANKMLSMQRDTRPQDVVFALPYGSSSNVFLMRPSGNDGNCFTLVETCWMNGRHDLPEPEWTMMNITVF